MKNQMTLFELTPEKRFELYSKNIAKLKSEKKQMNVIDMGKKILILAVENAPEKYNRK